MTASTPRSRVFAGKDPMLIDRVEVLRGRRARSMAATPSAARSTRSPSARPTTFQADAVLGGGNYGYKKARRCGHRPDQRLAALSRWPASANTVKASIPTTAAGGKEGWEIDDAYLELQLEGDIGDRFNWWLKVAD